MLATQLAEAHRILNQDPLLSKKVFSRQADMERRFLHSHASLQRGSQTTIDAVRQFLNKAGSDLVLGGDGLNGPSQIATTERIQKSSHPSLLLKATGWGSRTRRGRVLVNQAPQEWRKGSLDSCWLCDEYSNF